MVIGRKYKSKKKNNRERQWRKSESNKLGIMNTKKEGKKKKKKKQRKQRKQRKPNRMPKRVINRK